MWGELQLQVASWGRQVGNLQGAPLDRGPTTSSLGYICLEFGVGFGFPVALVKQEGTKCTYRIVDFMTTTSGTSSAVFCGTDCIRHETSILVSCVM